MLCIIKNHIENACICLDQRLDLTKGHADDPEPVKGQIVISLLSRDGRGSGSVNVVMDRLGNLGFSPDELPEG